MNRKRSRIEKHKYSNEEKLALGENIPSGKKTPDPAIRPIR